MLCIKPLFFLCPYFIFFVSPSLMSKFFKKPNMFSPQKRKLENHSETLFYFRKNWYVADPLYYSKNSYNRSAGKKIIQSISDTSFYLIQKDMFKEKPTMMIGVDNMGQNIGIKSVYDFHKFGR